MKNKCKLLLSLLALILVGCSVNDGSPNGSYFTYYDESLPSSEKYKDYGENPFLSVSEQPLSTFSIDADGASYSNMRRYLYLGQRPPVASVRIEEYINYFTFDYAEPRIKSAWEWCCICRLGFGGGEIFHIKNRH